MYWIKKGTRQYVCSEWLGVGVISNSALRSCHHMSIFLLHVCMNRLLCCKIVMFTFAERWPCVGCLLRSRWCRTIPGSLYGSKGVSHAQTGLVCVTQQLFTRLLHHLSPRRRVWIRCDADLRCSTVHCTILVRITLSCCGILTRYIWYNSFGGLGVACWPLVLKLRVQTWPKPSDF